MAMVFQSYALYPHMTVAENIAYPLKVRKLPAAEVRRQVQGGRDARFSSKRSWSVIPRQLSGGQRQRVALARAMCAGPRSFLMDEPLSNLDAKLRGHMRAELKHMQHQLGITTIYVTHDQIEAMTLAHRVALLEKGVLQQLDTPATSTTAGQPLRRRLHRLAADETLEGTLADGRFLGLGRQLLDAEPGLAQRRGRRRPAGRLPRHRAERRKDRRRSLCHRTDGRSHAGHLPGRRCDNDRQGRQDLQPSRRRSHRRRIFPKRPSTCSTRRRATKIG